MAATTRRRPWAAAVVGSTLVGLVLPALVAVLPAAASGSRQAPALVRRAAAGGPCGRTPSPPAYRHVVWVVMENDPYSAVIGSPSAPFTTTLARACGVADRYQAVTHPSLPNYLALTAGTSFGIADDNYPSSHLLKAPSIFSEVTAAHLSWRAYEESMTVPCEQVSAGRYAVKHNPAAYFLALRAQCRRFDVPMGTLTSGPLASALASARLPSFALVTPNVCHDGHSCPLSVADDWLRRFIGRVVASRAYRLDHLAVFVTWDEGSGYDQRVPLVAVAPSVRPHTVATGTYDHYSLLRTTEQLLHLPLLAGARRSASMVTAFNL